MPQEETLSALDELVRSGKVGAVGASNFTGDQLAEALEISELEGLVRYEWVQNSHSLLDRGDAETVFPVCREHGIGYECFGPLAGGWLTGKYRRGESYPEGSRMTQRPDGYLDYAHDRVFSALERFEDEAASADVSMAGLALAWLLAQDEITAVVVGPGRARAARPGRARRSRLRLDRSRDSPTDGGVRVSVLVLTDADVRELLDMESCIEAMTGVLAALQRDELSMPLRFVFRPGGADKPDGLHARAPRRRFAALLAQGDRDLARQLRARPGSAPGRGDAPRRRDRAS